MLYAYTKREHTNHAYAKRDLYPRCIGGSVPKIQLETEYTVCVHTYTPFMMEVKFYLSRVFVPVGDFRISPWNFDGGPHADTPAHYPLARYICSISASVEIHYHLFQIRGFSVIYTRATRNTVSHRTNLSNCFALSRDHTATLAHASSYTERRSFDELTRTVNHSSGEGLELSGGWRKWPSAHESTRSRADSYGHVRTRNRRPLSSPVSSSRTTLCCCLRASRGVAWPREVAQRALYTV